MKNQTITEGTVHIEGTTFKMEKETQDKFKKWDEIVKNNTLELGSEDEQKEIYKLLKDPTIYAYAFLRGENQKPFKLYSYQDKILNDNHKRVLFCAANQIGKSISLCVKGLTFAILNPGTTTLMISKTLPQSKDLLRQIKMFLQNSTLKYRYDIGDSETKTEIYFRHYDEITEINEETGEKTTKIIELNQSRIICVPATEAALGYPADLALVDELAFYDDGEYFYYQILQPRTYQTKGQIMVFSNPNGQQGIFFKLWNSPFFNKYRFNFLDCPTNTENEFKIISQELTQEQIDSTLLAVFTNPQGGFITLAERNKMQDRNRQNKVPMEFNGQLYIFFDFAKVRDKTVRGIGYPIVVDGIIGVEVFEMYEYPSGTKYNEIIDELQELINFHGRNKIAMVGWDNTGVGKGIEDFIKRIELLGINCMPVEFSLQNKSAMYTLMKLLIERNMNNKPGLIIPYVEECDKQLSKLRFKKSTRGYLQVHHEKESDKDDFPDMLAGLCSLIIQPDNAPVSVTIIGDSNYSKSTNNEQCKICQNWTDPWDEKCTLCGNKIGV